MMEMNEEGSSPSLSPETEIALFAAGCFWGVEDYFLHVPGVIETEVGYSGGHAENPTYKDVCYKHTGHAETVKIIFDPNQVTYAELVRHFFRMHNPTTLNRQGPDVGDQYRSAIFYRTPSQQKIAEQIKREITEKEVFSQPIVTEIALARPFYRAEEYHQKYTQKTGHGGCHITFSPL